LHRNRTTGTTQEDDATPLQLHSVNGIKTEATWNKLKRSDIES